MTDAIRLDTTVRSCRSLLVRSLVVKSAFVEALLVKSLVVSGEVGDCIRNDESFLPQRSNYFSARAKSLLRRSQTSIAEK